MSDTIKPALTAEEWATPVNKYGQRHFFDWSDGTTATWMADGSLFVNSNGAVYDSEAQEVRESRHAVAALCLYGQPFGFTREDVALVLDCIGMEFDRATVTEARDLTQRLNHLANRIAALLPPK